MKEDYLGKGTYAGDFSHYFSKILKEKGFADEIATFEGGGRKLANNSSGENKTINKIYKIKGNSDFGLAVVSMPDFKYNADEKKWAFVKGYLVPLNKIKDLGNGKGIDLKKIGKELVNGEEHMVTSNKGFEKYMTFKELGNELLGEVNEKILSLGKSFGNLEEKVVSSVFGFSILAGIAFGLNSITGAAIGFASAPSSFLGAILFIGGILGLYFSKK
ncbi:MAG: hypothetical protein KC516_03130 [Nanoarchaeota archaeon]|nr:hypothetical protein [Nanoarchaeota archaeon]